MVSLQWLDGLGFTASLPSGNRLVFDSTDDVADPGRGSTPMETLLASIAACSAMDVVSILLKKRQKVTGYRVEIEGDRGPKGEWPRPFTAIRIRHFVKGTEIDPGAVERAVQLSDEKYCSVIATLRSCPHVTSEWTVE